MLLRSQARPAAHEHVRISLVECPCVLGVCLSERPLNADQVADSPVLGADFGRKATNVLSSLTFIKDRVLDENINVANEPRAAAT